MCFVLLTKIYYNTNISVVLSNKPSSRVIKYQKCTIKCENKLVAIASIYIKQLNIALLKASKQNILAVKSN